MSIRLENICYNYRSKASDEIAALDNINLTINDGELIGIIGKTGSGKSTLIQHLNGLLRPSQGRVLYDGEDIHQKGYPLVRLRKNVGLVFQFPEYQLFENTVFADVAFGPRNNKMEESEIQFRVKSALEAVALDETFFDKNPLELSGGQKRRVAIAGILAMDPKVLVLDEPTVGLDPQGRDEILEQITKLHQEKNITIILVSHDMEIISKYTQRVIVMSHGRIVNDNTVRKIFATGGRLAEIGLGVPQVTELVQKLREHGFHIHTDVLSIDEAKKEILSFAKNNLVKRV